MAKCFQGEQYLIKTFSKTTKPSSPCLCRCIFHLIYRQQPCQNSGRTGHRQPQPWGTPETSNTSQVTLLCVKAKKIIFRTNIKDKTWRRELMDFESFLSIMNILWQFTYHSIFWIFKYIHFRGFIYIISYKLLKKDQILHSIMSSLKIV